MEVKILSKTEVDLEVNWCDAIISIRDTHKHSVPFSDPGKPMLVLGFQDTERPDELEFFRMQQGTERALTFGKQYEKVIVHCNAGVSRSAAIAWLLLVQDGMDPFQAFRLLYKQRPIIWPNQVLMDFGDSFLQKGGTLRSIAIAINTEIAGKISHYLGYGG